MTSKLRLQELFKQYAIQFGDFTLASGLKSNYYINSKKVLFQSEAISLLGDFIYEETKDLLTVDAVGGLEVGAIPMTATALMAYHRAGMTMNGFFVRKKAKEHGSKSLVEGIISAGDKVVVVDDVLTTGGSALQAVKAVEAIGANVVRVICICDRLQGAATTLAGYDFRPLYTIKDFGV